MAERITEAIVRAAAAEAPQVIDSQGIPPAAVIVPVRFDRGAEALAVVRASTLRDHAGEVAFPGGKPELRDADLAATALRELEEEVGVGPDDVEIVGALTPVPVINRKFLIHAFVAIARPGAPFRVASSELAEIVTLPLDALVSGARRHAGARVTWRDGSVHTMPHFWIEPGDRLTPGAGGDRVCLYGASAYLFMQLLRRIAGQIGVEVPAPELEERLPWGDRYRRDE